MTERIGLSLVLLLIAMAQLATDVARLALEASSRPSINEPAPAPAQPGVFRAGNSLSDIGDRREHRGV